MGDRTPFKNPANTHTIPAIHLRTVGELF